MSAVDITIGGVSYLDYLLRVETWRTVNAVGNWGATLRNTGGVLNGVFDVQDAVIINLGGVDYLYGFIDGPAVKLQGKDAHDDWDEYIVLRGVDRAQDLMFHNDFELSYPDNITQLLEDVMDDVFNTQLKAPNPIITPINYVLPGVPGTTPLVGAVEFREGASFLGTVQEMMNRVNYVFYVDDSYDLYSGIPGFDASGFTGYCIAGDVRNNIIIDVGYQERDGDKLYNYVRLYGKNPMFDGYTEQNAATAPPATGWVVDTIFGVTNSVLNDNGNAVIGDWSVVACAPNPVVSLIGVELNAPVFNYDSWDFSKGDIGVWVYYDNLNAAPGAPGVGNAANTGFLFIFLDDSAGNQVGYYGTSTGIYIQEWNWCSAPLGEGQKTWAGWTADNWYYLIGANFLWDDVVSIHFIGTDIVQPGQGAPSHLYIDGISIPIPIVGEAPSLTYTPLALRNRATASVANYRRRPYVEQWDHIIIQNAIQAEANMFLDRHVDTDINKVNFTTPGTTLLQYGGQGFDLLISNMNIYNGAPDTPKEFYATSIHQIIEPRVDITSGYGFDWITEVEGVEVQDVAYDMSRLSSGMVYPSSKQITRVGTGLRIK